MIPKDFFVTLILLVITVDEQFSSFAYNLYSLLWIACSYNLPLHLLETNIFLVISG